MKKSYDTMERSINFHRVLTAALSIVIVVGIATIDTQEDEITRLEAKVANCKANDDSEQRFQDTMRVLHLQNARVNELEAANEALISVCNPSKFRDVAKCTPLPKIKRV